MHRDNQEIARKLKISRYAEATAEAARTCRYFGIGCASFYRWLTAYRTGGEAALVNGRPIPKNPPSRTPLGIVEKVLHPRQDCHLGPVRIVWYLARYHGIKISDVTVYRILKHHNLIRLLRGTRVRKAHTKHYNKQVPDYHTQMDVKFLIFEGKAGQTVRRLQYTAIDDSTWIRALKVYDRHTRPTPSTSSITSSKNSPSTSRKSEPITATSSRPSFICMLRTRAFGTPISSPNNRNSTAKSRDRTVPLSRVLSVADIQRRCRS